MRLRDPRNASLLILATDTVVIALIVIILASLGVGFLIGYKITDWTKDGILLFSGGQSKAPQAGGVTPVSDEQKPQEAAKDAAVVPPESPPKEQQAQTEEKSVKAPGAALQQQAQEAKSEETKAAGLAKPAKETEPKQSRTGASTDSRPKKPAREAASAKKAPGGEGPEGDSAGGSSAPPARVYTIQTGAYPLKHEAEQLQQRLAAKGFNAYVVNEGEQDPYFRVRVGKFRDRKSAEQAAASLREKTGADSYILVTKP